MYVRCVYACVCVVCVHVCGARMSVCVQTHLFMDQQRPLPPSLCLPSSDQVLLDASNSEDDLGQDGLTYLWEEVTGPLDSEKVSGDAVLELKSLKAGKYKFK